MTFNRIDFENWARKPYYEHYMNQVRCTYSMTANIDITDLLALTKRDGMKLYPVLLHMITTVVNQHVEFRMATDAEGNVGYWEAMSPSFTIFHEDDKTFSSIWTAYDQDFALFYKRYMEDMAQYGNVKQFAAKSDEPPNTVSISSIPWVNFSSFNLNIYNEGSYLLPIFTMGKYNKQDGRVLLPVSIQLHHAVCDGYHAGVLFEGLQNRSNHCEQWLPAAPL